MQIKTNSKKVLFTNFHIQVLLKISYTYFYSHAFKISMCLGIQQGFKLTTSNFNRLRNKDQEDTTNRKWLITFLGLMNRTTYSTPEFNMYTGSMLTLISRINSIWRVSWDEQLTLSFFQMITSQKWPSLLASLEVLLNSSKKIFFSD